MARRGFLPVLPEQVIVDGLRAGMTLAGIGVEQEWQAIAAGQLVETMGETAAGQRAGINHGIEIQLGQRFPHQTAFGIILTVKQHRQLRGLSHLLAAGSTMPTAHRGSHNR